MKKFVLVMVLAIGFPVSATTFEFTNKRKDKKSINVEVTQANTVERTSVLPDETATITFDGDNKNIDLLTLETIAKTEAAPNGYYDSYAQRDVIQISQRLSNQEKKYYKSPKPRDLVGGKLYIEANVYEQPALKGKTKFAIDKAFDIKGHVLTGFFKVHALD